jgi:anaerobic selenocysteine-containing dehydrogenase
VNKGVHVRRVEIILLVPGRSRHHDAPEGKLDLLVTLDFRMSTTCVYSDIVLPTATWYEKNDLNTSDMHPFIHPLTSAVDPVWECKSDWDIYKAIAMGSPYVKAVCMGRALMIPGMVGKNIGVWLKERSLPKTVSKYGQKLDEIFILYEDLVEKYGKEAKNIPLGALGIYTFSKKLEVGLQQLMAGSRKFRVSALSRRDLMSLTEEAERISGIPYVMSAYREEAEKILEE